MAPQLDAVKIQEFINKKIKGLPINPDIVLGIHRFRNMSAKDRPLLSEEKEMRAYREKIEKDSLLFANILKIANSALYGYSGMISTLQRAVFVLGAKTFSEVMFQAVLSKDF